MNLTSSSTRKHLRENILGGGKLEQYLTWVGLRATKTHRVYKLGWMFGARQEFRILQNPCEHRSEWVSQQFRLWFGGNARQLWNRATRTRGWFKEGANYGANTRRWKSGSKPNKCGNYSESPVRHCCLFKRHTKTGFAGFIFLGTRKFLLKQEWAEKQNGIKTRAHSLPSSLLPGSYRISSGPALGGKFCVFELKNMQSDLDEDKW